MDKFIEGYIFLNFGGPIIFLFSFLEGWHKKLSVEGWVVCVLLLFPTFVVAGAFYVVYLFCRRFLIKNPGNSGGVE